MMDRVWLDVARDVGRSDRDGEIAQLRGEIERLRAENEELRRTFGSHPLFAERDAEIERLKMALRNVEYATDDGDVLRITRDALAKGGIIDASQGSSGS